MEIKPVLCLESGEALSKALNELLKTGTSVVIVEEKKYKGIIDDRDLSYGISDASRIKCSTVCVKAPMLSIDSSILERLNAFMAGHFKGLPVQDERGRVIGLTTRVELMKELINLEAVPLVPVSQLMNSPAYAIDFNEDIAAAKRKMKENNAHRLVVMRNGYPQGIISSFDFAGTMTKPKGRDRKPIISEIKNPDKKKISDILRDYVLSIDKNASVFAAVEKMIDKEISSIIVVSGRDVVGVFSATDLFKHVLSQFKHESNILVSGLSDESIEYLKDIRDVLGNVVKKFEKSLDIKSINVHVKEGKSVYSARAFVGLDKDHISLASEGYSLMETINELARELQTVLHKRKEKQKTKKGKTAIRD